MLWRRYGRGAGALGFRRARRRRVRRHLAREQREATQAPRRRPRGPQACWPQHHATHAAGCRTLGVLGHRTHADPAALGESSRTCAVGKGERGGPRGVAGTSGRRMSAWRLGGGCHGRIMLPPKRWNGCKPASAAGSKHDTDICQAAQAARRANFLPLPCPPLTRKRLVKCRGREPFFPLPHRFPPLLFPRPLARRPASHPAPNFARHAGPFHRFCVG